MQVIKTKSFELAVNTAGDPNSEKVAVLLPGRLDTKDYISFVKHLTYLADHGFYALSFDPPGTWESPGGLELFTTTNYIQATHEVIEYLGNKPTLLIGHSRGGAVAIIAGTSNPAVKAIVALMATYGEPSKPYPETLTTGFQPTSRDLPPGDVSNGEKRVFSLPLAYFVDGEKYDVMDVLTTCTKPKLLFYGTDDAFTKPSEIKEVFQKIPEPKMLHELHTTHDYRLFPESIQEVHSVLDGFLNTYPIQ